VALRLAPSRPELGVSRRPRLARWVAVGLGGVGLLVAVFAAGRLTAPTLAGPAVATAPTGGAATAAAPATIGPGPYDIVDDVPVGYAHTEAGAIAAATNYIAAISDKRAFNEAWRTNAYQVMAAPDAYQQLVDSVAASYQRIDADLGLGEAAAYDGSIQAVTVPLGYRVDAVDEQRATITVWAAGWLARPQGQQLPLRATANTVELVWVNGDWKLLRVVDTQPLNPPGVSGPPTVQALQEMAGFVPYEHVPRDGEGAWR
jgi:hypothetical protein